MQKYYALGEDDEGTLRCLYVGEYEDYDSADEAAIDMSPRIIWLLDEFSFAVLARDFCWLATENRIDMAARI